MKQFNVRDETHQLGKSLCYRTGKTLADVVAEAMKLYDLRFEEQEVTELDDFLVNKFFKTASEKLCTEMCKIVRKEVPSVVGAVIDKVLEERERKSQREAALLRRSEEDETQSFEETYTSDDESAD